MQCGGGVVLGRHRGVTARPRPEGHQMMVTRNGPGCRLKRPAAETDSPRVTSPQAAIIAAPPPGVPLFGHRWASVRGWLPHGRSLPEDAWAARNRGVQWLLVLHIPAILAFAGFGHHVQATHILVGAAVPAVGAVVAGLPALSRSTRACVTASALMLCSALIVHLAGGAIEAHFHFFVMIPIIALYEDWLPFGLAIGFVLVEHGGMGTLMPRDVTNEAAAWRHPWIYAAIHAGFFAAAAAGCLLTWRLGRPRGKW